MINEEAQLLTMKDAGVINEEAQLLPGDTSQSGKQKLFTGGRVAAALLMAAAGGFAFSTSPPAAQTQLSSAGFQKAPTDVLLYKRTHISTDPEKDCLFLRNVVGMNSCEVAGVTPTASGGWCGMRAEGFSDNMCFHNVKDGFAPKGDAKEWIARMNKQHEATFASDSTLKMNGEFRPPTRESMHLSLLDARPR